MYALPGGVIEKRRQPICRHLIVALLGAVLLILDFVAVDDKSGAVGMALLVAGVAMLLFGAIVAIIRLMSEERAPYHTPSKRYMRFRERYYDREQLSKLQRAVASGDVKAIDAIPEGNVSAITLVESYATNRDIVAYAIYEYVNFDNSLIGEVKLLNNK